MMDEQVCQEAPAKYSPILEPCSAHKYKTFTIPSVSCIPIPGRPASCVLSLPGLLEASGPPRGREEPDEAEEDEDDDEGAQPHHLRGVRPPRLGHYQVVDVSGHGAQLAAVLGDIVPDTGHDWGLGGLGCGPRSGWSHTGVLLTHATHSLWLVAMGIAFDFNEVLSIQ